MGPSFLSKGFTPWGALVFMGSFRKDRMGGIPSMPPPTTTKNPEVDT